MGFFRKEDLGLSNLGKGDFGKRGFWEKEMLGKGDFGKMEFWEKGILVKRGNLGK